MNNIQKVRSDFDDLKETRQSIKVIFNSLSQKIETLQCLYVTYVQRGKDTANSFGIDSLHFQRRYLLEDHNSMKQMFAMINNQVYRDYYKLHKLLIRYIDENISERKVRESCRPKRVYTVYKDLEPYREYDFDEVLELHHDITHVVNELFSYTSTREKEWKNDEGKAVHGLNIDNFVTTEKFHNMMIEHKAKMFLEYLQIFNKFHLRYFSRFSLKLRLMYSQIQKDIKLEETNLLARQHSDNDNTANTGLLLSEDEDAGFNSIEAFNKSPEIKRELDEIMDNASVSSELSMKNEPVHAIINDNAEIHDNQPSPTKEILLHDNVPEDLQTINLEILPKQQDIIDTVDNYDTAQNTTAQSTNGLTEQQLTWQKHNRERIARKRGK